uniref:Uncharacterized protein n=1 Tax=Hyaloperonospora arabidopsidis (strain Emoy2) TaxID=559515 RepID=M4BAE2_HYAAE
MVSFWSVAGGGFVLSRFNFLDGWVPVAKMGAIITLPVTFGRKNLYYIVILTAVKFFAYKFERKLYWSLIGAQKVKLYSLLETLLAYQLQLGTAKISRDVVHVRTNTLHPGIKTINLWAGLNILLRLATTPLLNPPV